MATGKSCYGRSNYRFLSGHHRHSFGADSSFELSESDIFNNSASSKSPEPRRSVGGGARASKKPSPKRAEARGGAAASLPVSIPDWSKILKEEYREKRSGDYEEDSEGEGDSDDGMRVPPHEFLARTRMASFSVHEGIGRTLKGRDLSRVRNAIWEKTGFED